MKVLIADDEPFILQGLSVLIDWESEGCEIVRKATNGMEALDYLRQNSVDLVISDIKMPEMSGLELLEKIRTEKISDAYFIFLSGYNEFAYAQKAMRYSCMDYLLKPVKKEALLERIREIREKLDLTMLEKEKERRVQEAYLRQCIYDLLLGRQGWGREETAQDIFRSVWMILRQWKSFLQQSALRSGRQLQPAQRNIFWRIKTT